MAFKTIKRPLYNGDMELVFNPAARNRYLINDKINNCTVYPVGVTTVLSKVLAKEALMLWPLNMALGYLRERIGETLFEEHLDNAAAAHRKKSDKGKDVGSEVHEAIETLLTTYQGLRDEPILPTSPEALKAFESFENWALANEPKVLATEQIVYSREHNYAGTFDALLKIDGQTVLCDVKTSNASQTAPLGIYPENFLQLGAYSLAYTENKYSFKKAEVGSGDYLKQLSAKGDMRKIDDLMVINASKTGKLSTLRASDLGLTVQDCEAAWLGVLNTYKFLEPLKRQIKEYNPQLELVQ